MKRLSAFVMTSLLIFGFAAAANAFSVDIDFYGGTTSYAQGVYDTGSTVNLLPTVDWAWVDIVAVDIPDDNGIAIFSWVLSFDPSNMQASNLDTEYPGFPQVHEIDNTLGTVKLEVLSTDPQDGTAVLGTFRIDCTAVSLDDLFIAQLRPNNNLLVDGTDFSGLYPQDALATVNQVPLPGAAWLLGSGLLGLVATRRRKKS